MNINEFEKQWNKSKGKVHVIKLIGDNGKKPFLFLTDAYQLSFDNITLFLLRDKNYIGYIPLSKVKKVW
jgi:hypothetical protein